MVDDTENLQLWLEDDESKRGNVTKLCVGESIAGELIAVLDSDTYEMNKVYRIRDLKTGEIKVLFGTTMLNHLLSKRKVGDILKIERVADKITKSGRTVQVYRTYSRGTQSQ
jgi:hypothetical protein